MARPPLHESPAPGAAAPPRVLALCADDFGINPGVSRGIARLVQAGRLSAVSCLMTSRYWRESSALLQGFPDTVDVGLHLNFTEGKPMSSRLAKVWARFPSLHTLILRAHLDRLPRAEVRHEVHTQLKAFIAVHGGPPKFIDGHQHVHHLPVLRDLLLDMVEHVQPLPAVRNTGRVVGPGWAVKRALIERTGGRVLARQLEERVMPHNPVLLGAYDFKRTDYRALMQRWLAALPPEGGLLFCHPGERCREGKSDPIAAARVRELAYLESDAFLQDLKAAGVRLGPVWRTAPLAVSGKPKPD